MVFNAITLRTPALYFLRPSLTNPFCISIRSFGRFHLIPSSRARAMSSADSITQDRMFRLKVDPLTGSSEWVVVFDGDNDDVSGDSSSDSAPLARTSYLDMLNDAPRNRAYRAAIDKAISRSKPHHVLDIGAGTGLLSMMAARAMGIRGQTASPDSQKGQVTACESFLPMVKLMHKVLRKNGLQRMINVIHKRSDEIKIGVDIDSRADFLVSEILDSELLGEGLIPTLQNAFDTLLLENPRVVPYRATTYGQLVESSFLWRLHDLYSNETSKSDGIHLIPKGMETILQVKPQQYPIHCDPLKGEIKLLSEPFRIFEFDFWKRPESHGETQLFIRATDDGLVNVIVSWWVLQLDCEGTLFYSTAPKWIDELQAEFRGERHWCDHWKQCVWFIPGKGLNVKKDEELCLDAVHNDISVSYDLKTVNSLNQQRLLECRQDVHLFLSPERMGTYGDSDWRSCMLSAALKCLQGKNSPLCVVADDSIFLAVLISHCSETSHVISLFPGLREKGNMYLQAVAEANCFAVDSIEVLERLEDCLTMHSSSRRKVDLLVGEPFYCANEGQLPWQNLRFWKQRTLLDRILSRESVIMPCKGILKACAVFLPDLWRSRCSLGKVDGFDHSVANSLLGACGNLPSTHESPCLPFFVWQCGEMKELSERFSVMEFDFSKPMHSCSGKTKVEFTHSGICHGFVLWIDWVMDADNSLIISSGPGNTTVCHWSSVQPNPRPREIWFCMNLRNFIVQESEIYPLIRSDACFTDHRYWKQGVKFLSEPLVVESHAQREDARCTSAKLVAFFDSDNGNLTIRHFIA